MPAEKKRFNQIAKFYTDAKTKMENGGSIKDFYNDKVTSLRTQAQTVLERMDNLFEGIEGMFGSEGNEMLVLVTELTLDPDTSEFLSVYPSGAYEKYNGVLKVGDRAENLRKEIEALEGLS